MKTEQVDKLLFTPGPLTTSFSVKQAMLRDLGSRDSEFIQLVREIRRRLLMLGGQYNDEHYTAIPMQGSGTFGIEAVIGSTTPPLGKLLVIMNGAYGKRAAHIARVLGIETVTLVYPENSLPDLKEVDEALERDQQISMVAVVHCETTTGILNPVEAIGEIVRRHQRDYFVDAMSSFGALPLDLAQSQITYLVSSSNKCIEGVPGFSYVLAQKEALHKTEGYARSVSLDLLAQYRGLEKDGQFRFTPPIQVMLSFHQALLELEAEGGVSGRNAGYRANHQTLLDGMRALGFREYLSSDVQSPIITTFHYPDHPLFDFEVFYRLLNDKGCVIYPGKLTDADCFRVGSIGRLYPADIHTLLEAVAQTLDELGIRDMTAVRPEQQETSRG